MTLNPEQLKAMVLLTWSFFDVHQLWSGCSCVLRKISKGTGSPDHNHLHASPRRYHYVCFIASPTWFQLVWSVRNATTETHQWMAVPWFCTPAHLFLPYLWLLQESCCYCWDTRRSHSKFITLQHDPSTDGVWLMETSFSSPQQLLKWVW